MSRTKRLTQPQHTIQGRTDFDRGSNSERDLIIGRSSNNTIDLAISELIETIDNTSNVRFRFNTVSATGFELIELTNTCPIAGLLHPFGIKFGRVLHENDPVKKALVELLQEELETSTWRIVAPLVEAGGFDLKKAVCRAAIAMAKANELRAANSPVGDHYSALDYRVTEEAIADAKYVRSFLPPLSWFPQALRDNVSATDILSIVGLPIESEILRLHIGRAAAGCSGYIRGGETEVYTHTYRSHLLLYGRPGTGLLAETLL